MLLNLSDDQRRYESLQSGCLASVDKLSKLRSSVDSSALLNALPAIALFP